MMKQTVFSIPAWLIVITLMLVVDARAASLDELGSKPLATIDGATLSLRDLEQELLSREGRQTLDRLLDLQMDSLDWQDVPPEAILVQLHGNRAITRNALVVNLLEQSGSTVRQELINILLVRQALKRLQIDITEEVIDREIARQNKQLAEKFGDTRISLADYVRTHEGKTMEQYRRSLPTQMAAGLHELVYQSAEIDDMTQRDYFMENSTKFLHGEGRRLSVIHIAYVNPNDPEEQKGIASTVTTIHNSIATGTQTFARWWRPFGKNARPSDIDGNAGWIERNGRSPHPQTLPIPSDIMVDVFAADLSNGPVLLSPYLRGPGGYVIRVEEERPESIAGFEEYREQVRDAYIESNLKELTKKTMRQLQAQANDAITIYPFAPLVAARRQENLAWSPLARADGSDAPGCNDEQPSTSTAPTNSTTNAVTAATGSTENNTKTAPNLSTFAVLLIILAGCLSGAVAFVLGKATASRR